MITIDQLLESVDLDFEPRFVTKDSDTEDGLICAWNAKPTKRTISWQRTDYTKDKFVILANNLKLAEFDGKPWQECIYEVPQKEERTKWIGKLCRFWDGDKNCFDYGILKEIDEGTYITNDNAWYYHCEPVRPDDDVIYKDAVNELKGAKNE